MNKKLYTEVLNFVRQNPQRSVTIGLGALAFIFMVLWGGSCGTVGRYRDFSTKEMEKRLDAEKNRDQLLRDKAALEAKVQGLEQKLAEQTAEFEGVKKSLTQQQLINRSFQDEINKLDRAKQELEEQLKQALWQGKISAPAKTKK